MLEDRIKEYLKENLSTKRYDHTIGVYDAAIELAMLNGADINDAKIAALGHDLAKEMPIGKQIEILEKHNIGIDKFSLASPQILHGFVSSILLREVFNIENEDILNAVYYHSTGREEMSLLEKIIYIADYIELGRDYPGVEELRIITKSNLNDGVLKGLDNTIKLLVDKGNIIHPLTMQARNYLILDKNLD